MTPKGEFDPAVCLDYIRAGVEAIIEDEVTSRFEAEELKVRFYVNIIAILYLHG